MEKISADIIVSGKATRLEKYAADELTRYLYGLFGIRANTVTDPDKHAAFHFIVCFCRDPLLKRFKQTFPSLSDQGYMIRKISANTLLLAGGSPQAAAWAVYGLMERYGVRFLIHDDILPGSPGSLYIPDIDAVFEPIQKRRSCMLFNELATGSVLWGIKQYKDFIGQMFKMRFNGIMILSFPQSPLIDYEAGGIRRSSGSLLFGQKIPIDSENIGYVKLPKGPYYTNPDLAGTEDFPDLLTAVREMIQTIIDEAKKYGMHIAMCVMPLEFPLEFSPLLEKPSENAQLGGVTTSEMGDLANTNHMDLVYAQIDSYLKTYKGIDEYIFDFPEHPQADSYFRKSWNELSSKYRLEDEIDIDEMLTAAKNNTVAFGGPKRAEREFKSAVAMLNFFDVFFSSNDLLEKAASQKIKFSVCISVNGTEVFDVLDRVLWKDASFYASLDYTSSRAVRKVQALEKIDTAKLPSFFILRLQDDNVGSLPQIATRSIDVLMHEMVHSGWNGFCTVFWPIGDLDPVFAYISHASWDISVTVDVAYSDLFSHLYGQDAVDQLCRAMHMMEDATILLDIELGPFFPASGIMDRYIKSKTKMSDLLYHVCAIYEQVLRILIRPDESSKPIMHKDYMAYWVARMEFSIHAIKEIDLLCRGGIAADLKDTILAGEYYEQAVHEGETALRALAGNLRDDADRSTLAAYYHFLVREVKKSYGEYLSNKK